MMTLSYLEEDVREGRYYAGRNTLPHTLGVGPDGGFQLFGEDSNPRSQCPGLFHTTLQGAFEIEQITIEASLAC